MDRQRDSGKAGQRDSKQANEASTSVREIAVPGSIPRYEIPGWDEQYGVTAGITGREFDLGLWSNQPVGEVMSRWRAFRRALPGFSAVALGNQVHGTEVMSLDAGRGWIQVEGIDGWVSTAPGILLTVTVADCIPVYLVAPGRGIGLLHAGWRGTAGQILGRGLERLKADTGSLSSEIVMHCGIGICGSCYEVGSEVMEGCGIEAPGIGPWHLDLREQLVAQAEAQGVAQITVSSWCSAHHQTSFYSHRASKGTAGRMVAYIGMSSALPPS